MVSKEGHTKQSLLGDRVMDAIFVEQFSIGVAQSTPGFRESFLGNICWAFLHCVPLRGTFWWLFSTVLSPAWQTKSVKVQGAANEKPPDQLAGE